MLTSRKQEAFEHPYVPNRLVDFLYRSVRLESMPSNMR